MVLPKFLKNIKKSFKVKMSGMPPPSQYPGEPAHVDQELVYWFNAVDEDGSGQISWNELQKALINAQGGEFSDTACKMLIEMCDKNRTGTIDFQEFQQLYGYVNQWIGLFRSFDNDSSGFIEEQELVAALHKLGFNFSPGFAKFLIDKYSSNRVQISVDEFIVMCIQIQRLTEGFRARDNEMKGVITIAYEDFLYLALNCGKV